MIPHGLIILSAALAWQEPVPPKAAPALPPLFTTMSFDAAREQSQASNRPILLYFSEAGNKQCQSYAEHTWPNSKFREWVAAQVVPIEADIGTEPDLARRYHAKTAPTLTIVLPDGKPTREIVGFRGPDLLIRLLDARLVDPVTAAKEALERSTGDPATRIGYARALEQEQRYAQALVQYLICVDGPAGASTGEIGSRLLAVEAFATLMVTHPPAADALKERRDRLREAVTSGQATAQDATLFAAMNAQLGAVDDTMAVYRNLKASAPDALITRLLRDGLVESLIAVRRYDDALGVIDAVKHFSFALEQQESDERRPAPMGTQDQEIRFRVFLRDRFIERTVRYYELLLGGRRGDDAAKIAEQMIAVHPSAKTYELLAAAALRAGKASEATLAQARKALELSGARPGSGVLTILVRTLQALGKNEEAAAIVKTHADRLSDVEEAEALRALTMSGP